MKKKLLTVSLLTLYLSMSAQVLTYVGKGALVTVQDQTLVYNGGGWQNAATDGTTKGGVVNNTGDIMLDGASAGTDVFNTGFTNATAGTNDSSFKLVFSQTDRNVYGQLWVHNIPQSAITGRVTKQYVADITNGTGSGATAGQQQIGLPFYQYLVSDLKTTLGGTWLNLDSNSLNYTGRFKQNSVFRYNNALAVFDQVLNSDNYMSSNSGASPTDYYAIPTVNASGAQQWFPSLLSNLAGSSKTDYNGYPVSDLSNVTVALDTAPTGTSATNFGTNGMRINKYNERYNTYLDDPFSTGSYGGTTPWAADYGVNLYQFSNPFLTNLDLSYLYDSVISTTSPGAAYVAVPNLQGIAYYPTSGGNTYQMGVGSKVSSNVKVAIPSGGYFQAGDLGLVFKPFSTFLLKLKTRTAGQTLNFAAGGLRVFRNSARATTNTGSNPSTSRPGSSNGTSNSLTSNSLISVAKLVSSNYIVKQVAVVLYNASGNELGRTYYAVSPSAISGAVSKNYLQSSDETMPIYTNEEALTGGVDESKPTRLYINSANEVDFSGKAIPMSIIATDDSYVKFELYEAGSRIETGKNVSKGSFYIEKNNVITQINDGDKMATTAGSYNLYFNKPQSVLKTNTTTSDQTVIGKYNDDYVVRFANSWTSANIEVYSAVGQLIFSKKNVTTATDYVIPLNTNNSGLYIVKAISDKGDEVVKKILK